LEEAREYEILKKSREKVLKVKRHRESAPYLFNAENDFSEDAANPNQSLSEGGGSSSSTARLSSSSRRRRGGGDNSNSESDTAVTGVGGHNGKGARKAAVKIEAAAAAQDLSAGERNSYPSGQLRKLTPTDKSELVTDLSKAPGTEVYAHH